MSKKSNVRSPEGMKVVASAGGEPSEEFQEAAHDEIRPVVASEELKDFACGHRGPKLYHLDLYGQVLHSNGTSPDTCGQCCAERFRADSCRCALCGLIIFPGDPVALYAPSPDFKRARVTEVKSGVLGCMRWDCCPCGGYFAGHWTGKGFRPAFSDGATAVEQCLAKGEVVVGDLSQTPGSGGIIETPLPPDLVRSFRPRWYRRLWDLIRGR